MNSLKEIARKLANKSSLMLCGHKLKQSDVTRFFTDMNWNSLVSPASSQTWTETVWCHPLLHRHELKQSDVTRFFTETDTETVTLGFEWKVYGTLSVTKSATFKFLSVHYFFEEQSVFWTMTCSYARWSYVGKLKAGVQTTLLIKDGKFLFLTSEVSNIPWSRT